MNNSWTWRGILNVQTRDEGEDREASSKQWSGEESDQSELGEIITLLIFLLLFFAVKFS